MVSVLENYSSFEERNNDGKTPYDLAVEKGHTKTAERIAKFRKWYKSEST